MNQAFSQYNFTKCDIVPVWALPIPKFYQTELYVYSSPYYTIK